MGCIKHTGYACFILKIKVLLKKVVEANIYVPVIVLLKEVRDQPVSDLGIKDEVADQVVLADEGRGILTEVVEDLHYLIGLHHFFESVAERINGLEVDEEALVGVVHLNKLHASVLGEAFAVHAENRRALRLDHVHDALRKLDYFPWSRHHVHI